MKILRVNKLDKYNYELSNNVEKYNLNIEFYGIPNTDDIEKIYIHEDLLKNKMISFGMLEDKSGKVIESQDDIDLIILIMKDEKKYLLKRLYG